MRGQIGCVVFVQLCGNRATFHVPVEWRSGSTGLSTALGPFGSGGEGIVITCFNMEFFLYNNVL